MPTTNRGKIQSFDLKPGRVIGGKYVVDGLLGGGWEGEVYRVTETRTGAKRAAKLFFPHRNEKDRAVTFYAKKLERLRNCPIVIHYHHSETIRVKGQPITCLISEYVEGILLANLIALQRGKRMTAFKALHVTYALAKGLEDIHRAREYHGDLHEGNVIVNRQGIFFEVKLVDFYHWGAFTAVHRREDVVNLIRILYEAVGGRKHYANQPPVIKQICRGMRTDLIEKHFPTARHLREHLETFDWG